MAARARRSARGDGWRQGPRTLTSRSEATTRPALCGTVRAIAMGATVSAAKFRLTFLRVADRHATPRRRRCPLHPRRRAPRTRTRALGRRLPDRWSRWRAAAPPQRETSRKFPRATPTPRPRFASPPLRILTLPPRRERGPAWEARCLARRRGGSKERFEPRERGDHRAR